MADVSMFQHRPDDSPPEDMTVSRAGLSELRQLLLGPEQERLNDLQTRLENLPAQHTRAEDVSRVLPEAIIQRTRQDTQLTRALTPTVEEALTASVRRDPRPVVDAIFPVIGPAIRKAIAHALQSMVQSLNATLEYSLSWRGLRWRWEAWRTGKSFAEVILLRTLVYRVEQVFLIHKETGLVLCHVENTSTLTHDPDMVSAMLTAIEDFVHDSFSPEENLDTFQVGDLTVWVEQGKLAMLAVVLRGTPPYDLRAVFQDTLDTIHLQYGAVLTSFRGDATPFASSRTHLEDCLLVQTQTPARRISPRLRLLFALLFLASSIWVGVTLRQAWRWSQYIQALQAEPGIVITLAQRRWGHYVITGLRDPLAIDPLTLLQAHGLAPDNVVSRWELYQALSPAFIVTRAQRLLAAPETVRLRVVQDTLIASGRAPHAWIQEASQLVRFIAGIQHVQLSELVDQDLAQLLAYKHQVEQQMFYFELGTTQPVAGYETSLQHLVTALKGLVETAPVLEQKVQVVVQGYTDPSGPDTLNKRLSLQRAEYIVRLLHQQGIDPAGLMTVGMGASGSARTEMTEQDPASYRRVSFQVTLTAAHSQ